MSFIWHVQLLGDFRVTQGNVVVSRFSTVKTGALLARLALFPHRPHLREELIDLLWPESDLEAGRGSLRTALASLRRQLETSVSEGAISGDGHLLLTDRTSVRLRPGAVTVDVTEFESGVARADRTPPGPERTARLAQAVDLYTGTLLPGSYEDWVLTERERLDDLCRAALRRLAAAREETGDLPAALQAAQRAASLSATDEASHHTAIRLLASLGQHDTARQQFRALERALRAEMDVEPAPQTRALIASLPAIPSSPTPLRAAGHEPSTHAAETVPSPMSPPAPALSLPMPLTRFFGRQEELAQIEQRLQTAETRLVTLTGPGGTGKTRLAIELARRLSSAGARVVFVALASLSDGALLPDAIAAALRLPRAQDPLSHVQESLNREPALLILDNMEQIAASGSPVVEALMRRVPGLTCLVTSRQRLEIPGEQEVLIPSLPTPKDAASPALLSEVPSVQLFVDRAQSSRPDFRVTPRNAPAVAALCMRLEGIPLALELAAAWSQALTPAQMLARLDDRFALLVSRRKGALPRHRTLWAAISWSYDLLPTELQRFWTGLSVFRGGWTAEAAQAVCGEPNALEMLARLRARSLISSAEDGDVLRFGMLETLREFAEKQEETDRGPLARRHADWCLSLAEAAGPRLLGPGQAAWLDRLETEHDNLRGALRWTLTHDPPAALRLVIALIRFWELHSHLREGRKWLEEAADRVGEENRTGERAKALNAAGALAFIQGDYAAAEALYTQGLAIWQEVGEQRGVAASLNNLGNIESSRENYEAALSYYDQALATNRAQGNHAWEAINLNNLGVVAEELGDLEAARYYTRLGLGVFDTLGDLAGKSMALHNLGLVARKLGDLTASACSYRESLELDQQLGDRSGLTLSLEGLATVAADQGAFEAAARLWGAAQAIRDDIGFPRRPAKADTHETDIACARAALGDQVWGEAWAVGTAMTPEQAITDALAFAP